MEGSILAPGGAVRVRPVDGGGNETLATAPASGEFVVRGLENGNYEAVDELGNKRVFTVTQGPGEEVVLERFGDPSVPSEAPLDPLHLTEAPLVPDQSHEIQAGSPAMTIEGGVLVRPELGDVGETAPPTIPGPNTPAVDPPVAPSAVVTEETVGNSSDAVAPTEPAADAPASSPQGQPGDAWSLTTAELVAVLDNDTAAFPQAGNFDVGAAVDELKQRAASGDADAQAALEKHSLVSPQQPETAGTGPAQGSDTLDAKSLAAVVAGADDAPAGVDPVAARDELERRAKDGDPDAEQALASLQGSDVPPADDPEHVSETPPVDPGAQA